MLFVAGRAALFGREVLMSTKERAWIYRTDRRGAITVKSKRADQRDDKRRRQEGQAAAITTQRDYRLARRVLIAACAIRQGATLAHATAPRRSPARPASIVEKRPAFRHAAATAFARRSAPAGLAPQSYPAASVRKARPLVRASVLLKTIRIGNHSAYTFTRRKCQIETRITAIDKGTCTSNHFFMRPWHAKCLSISILSVPNSMI